MQTEFDESDHVLIMDVIELDIKNKLPMEQVQQIKNLMNAHKAS